MQRFIYADNAATTQIDSEALTAMIPYLTHNFGNPSALYKIGRDNASAVAESRKRIASLLKVKESEIYFTSSGSEGNTWAIRGSAYAYSHKGKHIITTAFEHISVLNTMKQLEKEGFEITYLPVDEGGQINPLKLQEALRDDTVLVAIMYANNEIGSVLPIKKLAEITHSKGALFFTDAVQAIGNIPINIYDINVDMLSLSGHKIYAPKGIGMLYIKDGVTINPLINGGGQENGLRGGTENVAGIVALSKAMENALSKISKWDNIALLRNKLAQGILNIPGSHINGDMDNRLPGNLNVSFDYVQGESLVLSLDMEGIYVSTGSACTSGSLEPSHVLLSIGASRERALGSIRFSLSPEITEEDIDTILLKLPPIVQRLRDLNPIYIEEKKG